MYREFVKKYKEALIRTGAVVFFALASFHYLFVTRWPIGDDPAAHIYSISYLTWSQILESSTYPLPILLFKWIHSVTSASPPLLFVVLICSFLFLATCSLYFSTLNTAKSQLIAFAAATFFVTNRWVNDSLRMGVFAEVFSWTFFILGLFSLVKRNIPFTLLFGILLIFSHPLAFTIFVLTTLLYLLTGLITSKADRIFSLTLTAITFGIGLLLTFLRPELISKFLGFTNPEQPWGERSLWIIFTTDYRSGIVFAILAVLGVAILTPQWKKQPLARMIFSLLVISTLLILNYRFGMRFLPFRFYGYFFIAISLLGAFGAAHLLRSASFPKKYWPGLAALVIVAIILPSVKANDTILNWQAFDRSANASLLPADRAAISWLSQNVHSSAVVSAPWKFRIWYSALENRSASPESVEGDYIYTSDLTESTPNESLYKPVFEQDDVTLYGRR